MLAEVIHSVAYFANQVWFNHSSWISTFVDFIATCAVLVIGGSFSLKVLRFLQQMMLGIYDVVVMTEFMLNFLKTYTVEQIDEERNIWAEFTLLFKPKSNAD